MMTKLKTLSLFILINTFIVGLSGQTQVDIDLSSYNRESPIEVIHEGTTLRTEWKLDIETSYLMFPIQRPS